MEEFEEDLDLLDTRTLTPDDIRKLNVSRFQQRSSIKDLSFLELSPKASASGPDTFAWQHDSSEPTPTPDAPYTPGSGTSSGAAAAPSPTPSFGPALRSNSRIPGLRGSQRSLSSTGSPGPAEPLVAPIPPHLVALTTPGSSHVSTSSPSSWAASAAPTSDFSSGMRTALQGGLLAPPSDLTPPGHLPAPSASLFTAPQEDLELADGFEMSPLASDLHVTPFTPDDPVKASHSGSGEWQLHPRVDDDPMGSDESDGMGLSPMASGALNGPPPQGHRSPAARRRSATPAATS